MSTAIFFPTRKLAEFFIPGPAGRIEVATTFPEKFTKKVVGVIFHPDPAQGGTMNNKVVTTVARALMILDVATARFNFRGVEKSQGKVGGVETGVEDANAVMRWLLRALPNYDVWLIGFSWGSYVAAKIANQLSVERLISIAPPVHHYDFTQFDEIHCPWLVIQGDEDEVVPAAEVLHFAAHPPSPLTLHIMHGVGHFFHGRLIELRDYLGKKLSD